MQASRYATRSSKEMVMKARTLAIAFTIGVVLSTPFMAPVLAQTTPTGVDHGPG